MLGVPHIWSCKLQYYWLCFLELLQHRILQFPEKDLYNWANLGGIGGLCNLGGIERLKIPSAPILPCSLFCNLIWILRWIMLIYIKGGAIPAINYIETNHGNSFMTCVWNLWTSISIFLGVSIQLVIVTSVGMLLGTGLVFQLQSCAAIYTCVCACVF